MTHQEAIKAFLALYPSQLELAQALGVSQQSISNIKRKGILPKRYWPLLNEKPTPNRVQTSEGTGAIDLNKLTLSQARALYEELKEIFK